MALSNIILGQTASPNVPNISGEMGAGFRTGASVGAMQRQAQQQGQRFREETDQNKLIEMANDLNTALSMGPGQAQDDILKQALNRAAPGTAPAISINAALSSPNPTEKQELLTKMVQNAQQRGLLKPLTQQQPKQKTGSFLVRGPDGSTSIATGVFDPMTGSLVTEQGELPPGFELVSKLGETGAEQTERKVGQKRDETIVKGEEQRASELVTRGIAAAESTATTRRALDLLDSVGTGGFNAASLRAKQLFGIESGDEGELSNMLGKAVLSQLRETFGAAFTESEGQRLSRIEAGFGKSLETNRRLLNQALRIAERNAKRARQVAEKRGDTATVEDIDDLLSFALTNPEKKNNVVKGMSDEELKKIAFGGK